MPHIERAQGQSPVCPGLRAEQGQLRSQLPTKNVRKPQLQQVTFTLHPGCFPLGQKRKDCILRTPCVQTDSAWASSTYSPHEQILDQPLWPEPSQSIRHNQTRGHREAMPGPEVRLNTAAPSSQPTLVTSELRSTAFGLGNSS